MAPRIPPTNAETAPEAAKPVFEQLKTALGMVPNLYATAGHSPGSLSSLLARDAAVAKGPLSRREVELLNLHVSELNGCGTCLSAHTLPGRRSGLTADGIDRGRAGTATNALAVLGQGEIDFPRAPRLPQG